MGELVIVSGPPGAGKSTVAEVLVARREPSALIEGDAFFGFLRGGRIDPWLSEAHAQNVIVGKAAAMATACFAGGPFWAVYDGVVGPWALPEFVAAGAERIHYAVLLPSVEECVRRVIERDRHEFRDEAAARHMHAQFASAGIPDRHVIHGSSTDAEGLADEILMATETGRLLVEHSGAF